MTRWRSGGLVLAAALVYIAIALKFWMGAESQSVNSPDKKYWAAAYNHSPLLLPFWRTTFVLIPSYGDLNAHEVYRTVGFSQSVHLQWIDSSELEIICSRCTEHQLEKQQVDAIHVSLKVE